MCMNTDLLFLTHKHMEMHGCILSTVATDALVLKHQAISIHSAEYIFILCWPSFILNNAFTAHDFTK